MKRREQDSSATWALIVEYYEARYRARIYGLSREEALSSVYSDWYEPGPTPPE